VVAMGDLGQRANTFWQVVMRNASSGWKLVTPQGVADNGGLVVSAAGSRLAAAFLPSGDLTFSPLAASADGGVAWEATGLVPGALLAVPDALAGAPTLALVSGAGGGTVLAAAAGAPVGTWTPVVTAGSLGATAAGRACGVRGLTAVALGPGGVRLVGATCEQAVAGIFVAGADGWSPAPLALPSALEGAPVTVLRLLAPAGSSSGRSGSGRSSESPGGTVLPALAGMLAGGGSIPWVAACWSAAAGPWRLSPALRIGRGASLVSTGFGPAGEAIVVWRDATGRLLASTDTGPGGMWTPLPPLPDGTQAVVSSAAGTDALTVASTALADWRLDQGSHAWTKEQQLVVPIEFGSSG
jgi:hypothetical protein